MSLAGAPVAPDDFGPEYNSYVTDPLFGRRFTAVYVAGTLLFVVFYLPHLYRAWRTGRIWQGWAIYENVSNYSLLQEDVPSHEKKYGGEGEKSVSEEELHSRGQYPPTVPRRSTPLWIAMLKGASDRFQLRVHRKLKLDLGQVCVLAAYLATLLVCVIYQAPLMTNPNRAGFMTLAQLPFVFVFASKASPATFLLGRGYEKLNFIHRWAGRGLLLTASIHGPLWIRFRFKNNEAELLRHETKEIHGYITYSLLWLIVLASLKPVRRFAYDFFYAFHVALVAAFFIAVNYHTPYAIPWVVPPVAFYSFDLLVRVIRMRFKDAYIDAPDEHITFIHVPDVSGGWIAGQHVRLRVFFGSRLFESHPLSICNAPPSITTLNDSSRHGEGMLLAARNCGDWSAALNALARSELSEDRTELLPSGDDQIGRVQRQVGVMLDGPYGGSSVDFGGSGNVVLVGGGSGVTFAIGLLDDLVGRITKERRSQNDVADRLVRTRRVRFVWCIKSYSSILWFADRFATLSKVASDPSLDLHLSFKFFVTCACTPVALPIIQNCEVVQTKVNIADVVHGFMEELPLDAYGSGLGIAASGPESLTTAARNAVAGISVAQTKRLGGVDLHTEAYAL